MTALQLAARVLRLHRQRLTVAEIARALGVTETDVDEAYRVLAMPSVDDELAEAAARAAVTRPSPEQREAALDTMPKKMAERQRKAEIEGGKRGLRTPTTRDQSLDEPSAST